MTFSSFRQSWYSRLISLCLMITFITTMVITPKAQAGVMGLPQPGTMVNLSPAYVPLMVTGLTIHPENPLLMDFIVSTGNSGLNADQVKKESDRLIKYFLACLAIPENDQWVNLSPYEKQRIVPEDLGQTVLGQDMLAQDYLLKQLTASLIYPDKNLGKNFWDKVYAKASQMYGTTQVPVNTFNKVWILPEYAKVYEHKDTVIVVKSHLKVMLDEDYLALSRHSEGVRSTTEESKSVNNLGSQIVRQIILPAIEKEVNTGKNFAQLRQIYNSMILAVWFKNNLKQALLNQVYSDKSKTNGVNADDPAIKEKIYQQYLQAYKKGVFNYIKEEVDQSTQQTIPRKYFSGGLVGPDGAMFSNASPVDEEQFVEGSGRTFDLLGKAAGVAPSSSFAMTTTSIHANQSVPVQVKEGESIRLEGLPRIYWININNGSTAVTEVDGEPLSGHTIPNETGDVTFSSRVTGNELYVNNFSSYNLTATNIASAAMTSVMKWTEVQGNIDRWLPLAQQITLGDINLDMFRDYDYRYVRTEFPLKPEIVFILGLVWAKMALAKAKAAGIKTRDVLVARDARKIEPEIADALIAALRYAGLNVVFVGDEPNCVTSYSWAVQSHEWLMTIFNTASHVSQPENMVVRGFKVTQLGVVGGNLLSLTTKEIKKESLVLVKEILADKTGIEKMQAAEPGRLIRKSIEADAIRFNTAVGLEGAKNGSLYQLGLKIKQSEDPNAYIESVLKTHEGEQPLAGLNVVVEGSHTPSGPLAAEVFRNLGANVEAINQEVKEIFGLHNADPSIDKNLTALKKKITETHADFGIAFDLDGDRGAILIPEWNEDGVTVKAFHMLAPDNLLGMLIPSLLKNWGYTASGRRVGVIRDVLGTYGVNDAAKKNGVQMFQTDAGYVYLKALKERMEAQGFVFPVYGERSGHTWLNVSGEIENPVAVAVLFSIIVAKRKNLADINGVLNLFKKLTVPYSQSPRFQPFYHPRLLQWLSEHNDMRWEYKPGVNPPQAIVALGKDETVKRLGQRFYAGAIFGDYKVSNFNTYQDPADEGGLYRFADIMFEKNGQFSGRVVIRASSNDPTFVMSYEAPILDGNVQEADTNRVMTSGLVMKFMADEGLGIFTREQMKKFMNYSPSELEIQFNKANLGPVEEDLKAFSNPAMKAIDVAPLTVLPIDEEGAPGIVIENAAMAKSVDKAALAPGGIDLNSRNLNLESSGQKVNITFDPAVIAQFRRGDFSGVRIQILDVVPINLMPLLGLKDDEEVGQLAKA